MLALRVSIFASIAAIIAAIASQFVVNRNDWVTPSNDVLALPSHVPFWLLDTILLAFAIAAWTLALLAFVIGLFTRSKGVSRAPAALMLVFAFLVVQLICSIMFVGYVLPIGQIQFWLAKIFGVGSSVDTLLAKVMSLSLFPFFSL